MTGLEKELIAAMPECAWRRCWDCGKEQICSEQVAPAVCCRFCGSQDTRILREKTKELHNVNH